MGFESMMHGFTKRIETKEKCYGAVSLISAIRIAHIVPNRWNHQNRLMNNPTSFVVAYEKAEFGDDRTPQLHTNARLARCRSANYLPDEPGRESRHAWDSVRTNPAAS